MANEFEYKEDRTETYIKLVCSLGMSDNVTATYDTNLNLVNVENPPVSWTISDIKRFHDKSMNGLDESECDIRFMLKTQASCSTRLCCLCYNCREFTYYCWSLLGRLQFSDKLIFVHRCLRWILRTWRLYLD